MVMVVMLVTILIVLNVLEIYLVRHVLILASGSVLMINVSFVRILTVYLAIATKLVVTVSMHFTPSTRKDSAKVAVILIIVRLVLIIRGEISLVRSVILISLFLLMDFVSPAIS
jgi:hypothetical protein